jgi:hypothetical protein
MPRDVFAAIVADNLTKLSEWGEIYLRRAPSSRHQVTGFLTWAQRLARVFNIDITLCLYDVYPYGTNSPCLLRDTSANCTEAGEFRPLADYDNLLVANDAFGNPGKMWFKILIYLGML